MRKALSLSLLVTMALVTTLTAGQPAHAARPANEPFARTWARTDRPVIEGRVSRTWMWGPGAVTAAISEPYAEAPAGQRTVQYFDKTRMEINDPGEDPNNLWYVTNGLLARELITGQVQVGDGAVEQRAPAQVNIAGDPDDPQGPAYATFSSLMSYQPIPSGWTLIQTVDRSGVVDADPGLAGYGVSAALYVDTTNHNVASVFWDFMRSVGLVYENGQYVNAPLAENPFYMTGYPLTEAYWTTVRVAGTPRHVLVQVFERRVLTYTPDNPAGWQVEAGNVGQHYWQWRYAGARCRFDDASFCDFVRQVSSENERGDVGAFVAHVALADFTCPTSFPIAACDGHPAGAVVQCIPTGVLNAGGDCMTREQYATWIAPYIEQVSAIIYPPAPELAEWFNMVGPVIIVRASSLNPPDAALEAAWQDGQWRIVRTLGFLPSTGSPGIGMPTDLFLPWP